MLIPINNALPNLNLSDKERRWLEMFLQHFEENRSGKTGIFFDESDNSIALVTVREERDRII